MDGSGVLVLIRKRLLIFALFAALHATASDVGSIKALILKKLIHALEREESPVVYVETRCSGIDFPVGSLGILVSSSAEAKVVVTCDIDRSRPPEGYRKDQVVITLSYKDYVRHTDRAAGAFFWQKGRPNIIINARYLKRAAIRVPESYEPYVE